MAGDRPQRSEQEGRASAERTLALVHQADHVAAHAEARDVHEVGVHGATRRVDVGGASGVEGPRLAFAQALDGALEVAWHAERAQEVPAGAERKRADRRVAAEA